MTNNTVSIITINSNDTQATITRDRKTKAALLHVNEDKPWKLFAGENIDRIDYNRWVLSGNKSGYFPIPVDNHIHYCFCFTTDKNRLILAEKHLPMEGCHNFREMGGIRTRYGRKTRWGSIFRSDEITSLSERDSNYLASIPIKTIIDFRSILEIKKAYDEIPYSVKNYLPLSILPGNIDAKTVEQIIEGPTQYKSIDMEQIYRQLILDREAQTAYRKFFEILENHDHLPLLFHCTAGKDRTGIAAALLLLALGVDEDSVMDDYLASNKYLQKKYPSDLDIFRVKERFLRTALTTINENYLNVETYLAKILGVNINKLRQIYLV